MNTLLLIALALIAASIVWNIGRVREARAVMKESSNSYAALEAAAAELGRERECLRILRLSYKAALAAGSLHDTDGSGAAMWKFVDELVLQSNRCVAQVDFINALAKMKLATATAPRCIVAQAS